MLVLVLEDVSTSSSALALPGEQTLCFVLQVIRVDPCSPAVDTEPFLITLWRPAAAMTPPASAPPSWTLGLLVSALLLMTTWLPASAAEPPKCFSRQHQNVTVNVKLALNRQAIAMIAQVVRSEQDCAHTCCSKEVKPGEDTWTADHQGHEVWTS